MLAVDVMLPTARLVDALEGFRAEYPAVGLRLHVEALGAVGALVTSGRRRVWGLRPGDARGLVLRIA